MRFVQPNERVTLLLDRTYMPFQEATARAIFYHLLKGHGKGIDAEGRYFDFEEIHKPYMRWFDDQPCMRSGENVALGGRVQWPIPTIFVTNANFFYKRRKKKDGTIETATIRQLYDHYKGICQICGEKKKIGDFSKDHILPRSKGGTDHDFNLTLACKRCNSLKGSEYPYKNFKGEYIKPTKMFSTGFFMPPADRIRPEWRPFLFLD